MNDPKEVCQNILLYGALIGAYTEKFQISVKDATTGLVVDLINGLKLDEDEVIAGSEVNIKQLRENMEHFQEHKEWPANEEEKEA